MFILVLAFLGSSLLRHVQVFNTENWQVVRILTLSNKAQRLLVYSFRLFVAVNLFGVFAFDIDERGVIGVPLGKQVEQEDAIMGLGVVKGRRSSRPEGRASAMVFG